MKEKSPEQINREYPNSAAKIFNKGYENGVEHKKSSPETKEELSLIQKTMVEFNTHLKYIKEALRKNEKHSEDMADKNEQDHKDIIDLVRKWMEKSEKDFARKEDVDNLKNTVQGISVWRWMTAGGLGVVTMLVIPLVIYIFFNK